MSMVERVAQAIYTAQMSAGGVEHVEMLRLQARAAIKAMVEPTDKMCEAGDDGYYGMTPQETWQAMLTAALEEDD